MNVTIDEEVQKILQVASSVVRGWVVIFQVQLSRMILHSISCRESSVDFVPDARAIWLSHGFRSFKNHSIRFSQSFKLLCLTSPITSSECFLSNSYPLGLASSCFWSIMNTNSLLENCAATENRNDDSNPQQGTGGAKVSQEQPLKSYSMNSIAPVKYSRPSLKIPPTTKDERKLFVGGLPPNGTCEKQSGS